MPLRGASPSGEDVHVTVDKQAVKDSPSVEADEELSEAEERRLFEHYGVPYTTEGSTTARREDRRRHARRWPRGRRRPRD